MSPEIMYAVLLRPLDVFMFVSISFVAGFIVRGLLEGQGG